MKEIKHILNKYISSNPFSGQVMVARQNKIIDKLEYGYKDFETKTPFLEHQLFPIASITKQFTAVGILYHVDRGAIELNQVLSHYLPVNHSLWQGSMPKWATQITIHHLLSNSCGLPNYYLQALFNPNDWSDINNVDLKDLYGAIITKIKNTPLDFTPGSKFAYSDINFLILGIILAEIVPSHNLGEFYQEVLFKPFGLSNTIWPSLEEELTYIHNIYADSQLPKRYTVNYQPEQEKPLLVKSHEVNVPCGGCGHIFSTAEDLLKWNYALHGGKILKPESLDLMHTIHISTKDTYYLGKVSYGYGIIVDDIDDKTIYSHPGSMNGISTYLSYDPSNEIGIAILSNFSISDSEGSLQVKHPGRVLFNLIETIHRALR